MAWIAPRSSVSNVAQVFSNMTQTFVEIDRETTQTTCQRCGFIFTFHSRYRARDYDTSFCKDCKAKPVSVTRKNGLECKPWQGEFDLDTDQPMKDGKPYLVGPRICGHSDCVNNAHVLTFEKLEAERLDISYRTGIKMTHRELLIAVKRERIKPQTR